MTLERRLQHAARELREIEIVVPPLGEHTARRRRSPATLAPLLVPTMFVVGAVFALGVLRAEPARPLQSDITVVAESNVPGADPSAGRTPTTHPPPSVTAELQMIAAIVERNTERDDPEPPSNPLPAGTPSPAPVGPI